MKVTLVKHGNNGKAYWFEVPDHLVPNVTAGSYVACDTARGQKHGIVVGGVMEEADVKEVMISSGATLPLRQVVGVAHDIPMSCIKIPKYMAETPPRDEKIAKRFLEYYHDGQFHTHISVSKDGTLRDGYTAYLVAKALGLRFLSVVGNPEIPETPDLPF